MQEKLDEIEQIADEVQRSLDRITHLIRASHRLGSLHAMSATYELLKDESREMNRQSDLLTTKLNSLKEGQEMKRISLYAGLLLVLLLMVGGFAVAQDTPTETVSPEPTVDATATPDAEPTETAAPEPTPTETPVPPPPPDETPSVSIWVLIAPYIAVVVMALLGMVAYLGRMRIVQVGTRVPGVIFEPGVAAINRGLDMYGNYVATTPSQVDDLQYAEMRKDFNLLIEEMRQARNELNTAAAQLVSTSQSVARRPDDPTPGHFG